MKDLQVSIDDNSGFCFGVVYAIQMAEDYLNEYGKLYCLGDIVHNEEEVERLKAKGLQIISHDDLPNLKHERVLIRAHGEPPQTYKTALDNDIELIDASCPVVLKLQNRVREAYNDKTPILIYGKHGHAEVNGLKGQTNGDAIVIEKFEELDQIQLPEKIALTTSEGLVFKPISDIVRCESDRMYTIVVLLGGEKLMVSKPMGQLEEILDGQGFFRVHNSHLVNVQHIKQFVRSEGGYLIMEDGTTVSVARNRKDEFLELFSKF